MSFDLPIAEQPALDLRLWLRGLRDACACHNHASAVGSSVHWLRDGRVDALAFTGSGRIVVPNHPSLEGTEGTVFAGGDWRRVGVGAIVFDKRDAGGVQVEIGTSSIPGRLSFFAGGSVLTSQVDYLGAKSIAVTWSSGEPPIAYRDGAGATAYNGSPTINANDADITIGNLYTGSLPSPNPLSWVAYWATKLSEQKIARLAAWWAEQTTPELRTPGGGYAYPGGPLTGDLLWRAAIQTARVSLANESSGELGKSGLMIRSGTWRITEDSAGRAAECIADGQLTAHLLDADTTTTSVLDTEGSVTLTKTSTEVQLDASAGAKVRVVELAEA